MLRRIRGCFSLTVFLYITRLKSAWSKITVKSSCTKDKISQSGRVVYGAGFKFQSALQARVRIPPLTTHFKQVKIILPSSESSCNLPSTFCASTVRVPRLPPDSLTPCQIGVEPSRLLENGEGRIAQTCDPFLGRKRNEMFVHRGSCLLCIML